MPQARQSMPGENAAACADVNPASAGLFRLAPARARPSHQDAFVPYDSASSAKTCALTESRPSQRSWSGLAKISIGCPSQRSIARLSNKKPLRSLIQPPADSFGNSPCHFPMVGSQAEQTAEVCDRASLVGGGVKNFALWLRI